MGIFNQKPQGGNEDKIKLAYLSVAMKISDARKAGVIVCKHADGTTEIVEPGLFNMIVLDEVAQIKNQAGDAWSNYFRFSKKRTEITVHVKGGDDFSGTYEQLKKNKAYKDLECAPVLLLFGFLADDWTPCCLTITKSQFADFFKIELDETKSVLQINSFEAREIEFTNERGVKQKTTLHYPIFEAADYDFLGVVRDMPEDVKAKVIALDKYITSRLKEESREKLIFPDIVEPDHLEGGDEFNTDDYNDLPFDGDDKE